MIVGKRGLPHISSSLLGRILQVDLSEGKWTVSPYPEELAHKFLAGRGFNSWFLYHNLLPGTDPMGPENILILSSGLLSGTAAPSSSRLHINALSPLTGLLGSSNVGGGFGTMLRSCGIQCLVIRGCASTPVYLAIQEDSVRIEDAQSLWGLDTWETQKHLKKVAGGENSEIMAIGPGSENRALFACIITDWDHAAGRTGMGTVMGSKNLKAIVVKGKNRKTEAARRVNGRDPIKHYIRLVRSSPRFETLSTCGGAGYVKWADDLGILATRNYRESRFDAVDRIDGKRLVKHVIRPRGCFRCPVQCKAELRFDKGKFNGMKAVRPEFESMLALGSKCGLSDLETLVFLDNLCTKLGIDTMSAGSSIAFAMDLYERGVLTPKDTGGINLSWGNGNAMETLILQMAYREGIGAILSQGVYKASKIIGQDAERFAPHVKGLELAGFHPYNIMGTALAYIVSTRGGDFNNGYPSLEYYWSQAKAARELGTPSAVDLHSIHGKGPLVRRAMLVNAVLDCLGLCKVPALSLIAAFDLTNEAELTCAVTGWPLDVEKLFEIGDRIINLERLFNLRFAANGADDWLPQMFFEKEYAPGGKPLLFEWMEPMRQEFYKEMSWGERGTPSERKLMELDLLDKA